MRLRLLQKKSRETARIERPRIDIDPSSLVAEYSIGPVKYYILASNNDLILKFVEPEKPDDDRMNQLLAGIAYPSSPAEEYHLEKARSGYGILYPLIQDPHIEEIAFSGPGKSVVVVHKMMTGRWITVDMEIGEDEADNIAINMARKAGKLVSIATPYAEGLTREGHRVSVTLGREISRKGSSLVIRKKPEKPMTLPDLISSRMMSPLMAAYLWILVEAQGFNIIVGSMASGKTTVLQALAGVIPPYQRIVSIEDTPEIMINHPNWDPLIARPRPPGEEIEEVSLEDLLRIALRRRADHIIVGEVRGREARLLAQAAASGHGSMTTFHADGPDHAVVRLRLDPISLPPLFLRVVTSIVHVRKFPVYGGKMKRRVGSITEIVDDELVDVFTWDPADDVFTPSKPSEVVERSARLREAWVKLGIPQDSIEAELEERAQFLEQNTGSTPSQFASRLKRFYANKYGVA